jgi:hypothetical protein
MAVGVRSIPGVRLEFGAERLARTVQHPLHREREGPGRPAPLGIVVGMGQHGFVRVDTPDGQNLRMIEIRRYFSAPPC